MAKEVKKEPVKTVARKPIAPRKRDYSYADEGVATRGIKDSDYTLKPGANVRTVNPRVWEKGGRFVFRPLPMVAPETREEEAYRVTSEPNAFGDFFRSYPAVQYMGVDQQFDFLPYRSRRSRTYDPNKQNPYVILRNAVKDAVENGTAPSSKWNLLVNGKKAALPEVRARYYFQGPVFENIKPMMSSDGQKLRPLGLDEKSPATLVYLSGAAGDAVIRKLNEKKVGYRGDPMDFENAMVYGDPVITTGGRFICLYNPEVYNGGAVDDGSEGEEVEVDLGADVGGDDGKQGGFKGYEVEILDVYRPRPKQIIRPAVDRFPYILSKVVQWDDVIHVPTHEQLCLWIAQAFRSMPEVLRFGWQDHPEFFTTEVKAALGITKVTAVSAAQDEDEDGEVEIEMESEEEVETVEADAASDSLPDDGDVEYDADDYEGEEAEETEEEEVIDEADLDEEVDLDDDGADDEEDLDVTDDEEAALAAKFKDKQVEKVVAPKPTKAARRK